MLGDACPTDGRFGVAQPGALINIDAALSK